MKATKGLLLFGISVLVTACFNPPEFSVVPSIDYTGIYFKDGNGDNPDSLVVTITFKDGDGDLGLSATQIDAPYHDLFFYVGNNGDTIPVGKSLVFTDLPPFLDIPAGTTGKLLTVRSLQDPLYASKLPPYIDPQASCLDYKLLTVYLLQEDAQVIDNTFQKIDTLSSDNFPDVYKVTDVFYKRDNPLHSNIDVEFWVKTGNSYTLFDWEKEYCEDAFNQRFPELSDKSGPLEGNLTYAMTSLGIRASFSIKTLKLRIKIRDRAFNVSNIVETEDFTLDKIKR